MAVVRCACPRIDPAEWENKELDWENKTFYFIPINQFLFKPLNIEEKTRQLKKEIAAKGYEFIDPRVILCEWGLFKGRLMTQIKNPEVYDANIHVFDMGKIHTSVFKGKSKNFNQSVNDYKSQMELDKGIPVQITLVWYAHCKHCEKDREHPAVIFVKS